MITLDQIFDLRNKNIYIHCVTGLRSVVPITQVTGAGFRVFKLGVPWGPELRSILGLFPCSAIAILIFLVISEQQDIYVHFAPGLTN